ncbi:MAG: N-6 DNA methylase [Methylococcales bacterium]|nr:N-6 DNA methylase [Methylococcales bacterium]
MTTISIDTQRDRAAKFAKQFETASYEMGQAQRFVTDFCEIFGIDHRRLLDFETRVKKSGGKRGRIDAFIPSLLLVEMKSAGEDLDKAYIQATEYFHGLKNEELPRSVLVSDFQNLHLYNLETHAEPVKIKLADLAQKIDHFQFLAGYERIAIENQQKINEKAAEKMADLHDEIKKTGYDGKDLENYLVRLLFCLFAEDTGLFGENGAFLNYLHNHTKIDGSDLHGALTLLFDTLNTEPKKRAKNLPEHLAKFPYINGALFQGGLSPCYFDEATRNTLIECANLDWSDISPAIFGSLFQAVMHDEEDTGKAKTKKRREFGAHYTSDANIIKTINPLFMDDLRAEFEKCSKQKLPAFHEKLAKLNFFDPACGCGNFLIVAYRELRLLEIDVIKKIYGNKLKEQIDVGETLIKCDVHQFHGIDIDDSATHIATVAMWLVDHQMNTKSGKAFGNYFNRIPLVKKANIVHANALQIDWQSVIKPKDCSFIMGNPPFVGRQYQTEEQKKDLSLIFQNMNGAGVLDLVAAWHVKAARYIQENQKIAVAFVSTNSITQGEQVAILWSELLKLKVKLHFAHRTFRWNNEGRGVAAVHCVIMGFGLQEPTSYRLFDYGDDIKGEPTEIKAAQINPYLVDAPTVLIDKRRKPLSPNAPEMVFGNMPNDGGHLLLSQEEADEIRKNDLIAAQYIRPFLMGDEFLNNLPRFCLWLKDSTGTDRTKSPEIKRRVEQVKKMRLASSREATQKLAATSYLFGEIRRTNKRYLAMPAVSSENRFYIPIGYLEADTICGNKLYMIPDATIYDFGILTSHFHNAWMRAVAGRMKSDYSYSNTIVYNNFPFPVDVKPAAKQKIEDAAQAVLDARIIEEKRCEVAGQKCSLATMYAANNMPEELLKAHKKLDAAVDSAYTFKGAKDDAARVAFLFEKYQELVAPLVEVEQITKTKKSKVKK